MMNMLFSVIQKILHVQKHIYIWPNSHILNSINPTLSSILPRPASELTDYYFLSYFNSLVDMKDLTCGFLYRQLDAIQHFVVQRYEILLLNYQSNSNQTLSLMHRLNLQPSSSQ